MKPELFCKTVKCVTATNANILLNNLLSLSAVEKQVGVNMF